MAAPPPDAVVVVAPEQALDRVIHSGALAAMPPGTPFEQPSLEAHDGDEAATLSFTASFASPKHAFTYVMPVTVEVDGDSGAPVDVVASAKSAALLVGAVTPLDAAVAKDKALVAWIDGHRSVRAHFERIGTTPRLTFTASDTSGEPVPSRVFHPNRRREEPANRP